MEFSVTKIVTSGSSSALIEPDRNVVSYWFYWL